MKTLIKSFWLIMLAGSILFSTSCKKDVLTPNSDKQPTIIDTDVGIDDAMALVYLLQHPDLEILGITICGTGMSSMEHAPENTLDLLALAGKPDIPVAVGDTIAINSQNPDLRPQSWISQSDTMLGITLPINPNPPLDIGAVDFLVETIEKSDQDVRLIVLGPMTNIGLALQRQPTLTENIESIYIMGGAVNVSGNLKEGGVEYNPFAEWNIFLDPHAAEIVFSSGTEIVLVPLDATNHAPITAEFYNRLAGDHSSPEATFVYDMISVLNLSGYTIDFWDPLAAAIATDQSLASIETYPLIVVTAEGNENGRTKIDDENGMPCEVCLNVELADFEKLFIDVLNGRR